MAGLELAGKLVDSKTPLTTEKVQELYDFFLTSEQDFPEGVIGLGLAFGELVVAKTSWEWVRVIDEYGEETVVSPPDASINLSPISMIQKRLTNADAIDVAQLRDDTISAVQKMLDSGDYGRR